MILTTSSVFRLILYFIMFSASIFVVLPFALATITILRQRIQRRRRQQRLDSNKPPHGRHHQQCDDDDDDDSQTNHDVNDDLLFHSSALFAGRVWHTRFRPKRHSFTYPLFMFGINLEEIYNDSNAVCQFNSMLWPLSYIVSFNPNDHLKNGEGSDNITQQQQKTLYDRIFHLVQERTNGSFVTTIQTHTVYLMTHLSYYGYCFNPVSFYYIHNRQSNELECVIGEVSNTPWNEMYCYVLHPNSVDDVQCSSGSRSSHIDETDKAVVPKSNSNNNDNCHSETNSSSNSANTGSHSQRPETQTTTTVQYTFPKRFHVSPFMEMSFDYEWTFANFSIYPPRLDTTKTTTARTTSVHVINSLRPLLHPEKQQRMSSSSSSSPPLTTIVSTRSSNNREGLQFSAVMNVHRYSMHPYRIAYTICMNPMYCIIIQVWIHVQAFAIFTKGIPYQPHPNNTETSISRCIGIMMEPFFYIRDHFINVSSSSSTSKSSSTTATISAVEPRMQKNKIS